ncbi:hypothetical protein AB0399_26815 [Streptomyces sp. NPDC088194]|uniref:hypothetical protein n=1 Tax=Streptomyces sp. NPDC088194 TaxID=3154931 RepID=UPI003450FACA
MPDDDPGALPVAQVQELDTAPQQLHLTEVLARDVQSAPERVVAIAVVAVRVVDVQEIPVHDVEQARLEVERRPQQRISALAHEVLVLGELRLRHALLLQLRREHGLFPAEPGADQDAGQGDRTGERGHHQLGVHTPGR